MMGGWGGYEMNDSSFECFYWIAMSNNSQCPEEELTTCSGGPRIIILTSAVYGER
jgi:hypothetical protein